MSITKNPLEKLLIDPKETCEELLHGVLEKFIRFEKPTGEVILKPEFSKLTKKKKILIYLAARKAVCILGLSNQEPITSNIVSEAVGVELKTAREILSRLKSEKMVNSNSEGGWYIPDKNLILLPEYLSLSSKTE